MSEDISPLTPINGFDVDTDALAAYLRDLAAGIDEGDVAVVHADDGIEASADEDIVTSFAVNYIVDKRHEELLRPIEVDVDG